MQYNSLRASPGILLFGLFVFLLMSAPRANIKVGPVPVYFIDLLLLVLILMASQLPRSGVRRPFTGPVTFLFAIAIISEVIGMAKFGTIQESVYIIFRTALSFSVFFIVGRFVQSTKDIEYVLYAVAVALLSSSALMILTSLPMTRAQVADVVFSIRLLEPAQEDVSEILLGSGDSGIRGRTLVGVSIIGATFINIGWPLVALLLRWPWPIGLWRLFGIAGCLIAPLAVFMSYSRGPILGSILIILIVIVFGLRHVRRAVVFPVMIGVMVVTTVGVNSELFFVDRLTKRLDATFEAPLEDEQESERLLAYFEPFEHMVESPSFIFFGEGITVRYASSARYSAQFGQATHAVFAMAYYSYGLIGAIVYLWLLMKAIVFAGSISLRRQNSLAGLLAQPLFLSCIAMVPWAAFGHAIISMPRGSAMFFLVIGLVSTLVQVRAPSVQVPQRSRSAYVPRHNPAF
ncbi:MAG: O-antigen ligase family protein [Pseudomonadota bacterium]